MTNRLIFYGLIFLFLPFTSQAMNPSQHSSHNNTDGPSTTINETTNNVFDYCRKTLEAMKHFSSRFKRENFLNRIGEHCNTITGIEDGMAPDAPEWKRKFPRMVDPDQYNVKIMHAILDDDFSVFLTTEEREIKEQMVRHEFSDKYLILSVGFLMIHRNKAKIDPDFAIQYTGPESCADAVRAAYLFLRNKYWSSNPRM